METRTRILDGARRLLFARGYREFTVEALAAELGLARKTIYNHFPGKEPLVEAVFLYDAELWVMEISRIAEAENRSFTEKAELLLRQTAERLRERRTAFAHAGIIRRHQLREKSNDTFRRVATGPLAELLSEGIKAGHVRPDIDPYLLARGVLNVTFGHRHNREDPPGTFAMVLNEMIYALSLGILTEKGRSEITVSRGQE